MKCSFVLKEIEMLPKSKMKWSGVVAILVAALFFVVGMVWAATITIDGDPTDWPGHSTCTIGDDGCALLANDPAESGSTAMSPGIDVRQVWGTNDAQNLYIRIDTEGDTTDFAAGEFVRICLQIPELGAGRTSPIGGCSGLTGTTNGVTNLIFFDGLDVYTMRCDNSGGNNLGNCNSNTAVYNHGTLTGLSAVQNNIIEIGISFNALDITELSNELENQPFLAVVYFDDNDEPPDDSVPDSGSFEFPTGPNSPTAITLQSLGASANSNGVIVGLIAALAAALLVTSLIMARRQMVVREVEL
jgi:hypothetical protein